MLGIEVVKLTSSVHVAAMAAALLIAAPALALQTLTGDDAMTSFFDPNNTSPRLELQVVGSTLETTGGISLSTSGSFDLDIRFKDGGGPHVYDNLILTAALDSSVDNSSVEISVLFGGTETLVFNNGDFTDAEDFGLPFPADGITGIGNGSGEFLSLNGALAGGFDLMASLERGVTDVVTVSIMVTGIDSGRIVRFDIFGTDKSGNVIGNNPNSGGAGVMPEPSAALLFGFGTLLVGMRMRYRRQSGS